MRRSERLRRKQSSPGLPKPGAYSPYNDSYIVESEASFLDPPAPTSASRPSTTPVGSRRARYAASPHRYTDDSPLLHDGEQDHGYQSTPQQKQTTEKANGKGSDLIESDSDNEYGNSREGRTTDKYDSIEKENPNDHASPPAQQQVTPIAAIRTRRDDVIDRVRASLFDILSSNTRMRVNPEWRPVATPASSKPNHGKAGNRPLSRRNDKNNFPQRPLQSGLFQGALPRRPTRNDEDVVPSDDEREYEGDDDDNGNSMSYSIQRRLTSPLGIMIIAVFISFVVVLSLDARVSARRGVPSAGAQMKTSLIPVMEIMRSVVSVLFRNAWQSSGTPVSLPADILTKKEFRDVVMPELISAAREEAAKAAGNAVAEERRRLKETADQAAIVAAAAEKQAADSVAALEKKQVELQEETENVKNAKIEKDDEKFSKFAEKFAADKNLPPDFALASAGGVVIATEPSGVTSWIRFARAYATALVSEQRFTPTWPRPPSVMLEPDIFPGNCWAFDGSTGSVTIRLARPVRVSAITIEHTPRMSVFSVNSAMRMFRVIGHPVEAEAEEVSLGNEFVFDVMDEESRHLQTFDVSSKGKEITMRAVRVAIESNHGSNFTAIYRIRVHGMAEVMSFDGTDGGEL